MMRKTFVALAIAGLMLFGVPTTAVAVDEVPSPEQSEGGYTPTQHSNPTLGGSLAVGECERDVPWIYYAIKLTDPDNQSTGHFARIVLTSIEDPSLTTTIDLGELEDGELSGRTLWPGASIDDEGNPTGWPGWVFEKGQWVETDKNFGWTRGPITAKITVNPEMSVPLSYPPATPVCATDPTDGGGDRPSDGGVSGGGGGLPATGVSAMVVPIGIVGGAVLLLGVVLLVARRRHS